MNWDAIGCVLVLAVIAAPFVAGAIHDYRNPPPPWRDLDGF
jgi:hypothetical protein